MHDFLQRLACAAAFGAVAVSHALAASDPVHFGNEIRPLLGKYCIQCHGPDPEGRKAGLRLDTREGALAPLGDGPAVAPASASGSYGEQASQLDATHASVRLRWTASPDPVIAYQLYRRNPGGGRSWIGATAGTAFFLSSVEHVAGEEATVLEIEGLGELENAVIPEPADTAGIR